LSYTRVSSILRGFTRYCQPDSVVALKKG